MHPLHEYVAAQVAKKLAARTIVVWYDPRRDFAPFINELRAAPRDDHAIAEVSIGGATAHLVEFAGSFLELRTLVEPIIKVDEPERLVVYLTGVDRDDQLSLLMELEKAGERYRPELKQLARIVLRRRYTDGIVDEILAPDGLTYADLAQAAKDDPTTGAPSPLRMVFDGIKGDDALLAAWLASDARDAAITERKAVGELVKLARSRIGLELADGATLAKLRAVTVRHVLAGEFRSDLAGPAPAILDGVPAPKTKDDEAAVRALAHRLRATYADEYERLADDVERELGLGDAKLPATALGSIDTFRFEEAALLVHCSGLIAERRFADAHALVAERERSFWLDRDVTRKAQWEVCRGMAEVGTLAASVRAALSSVGGGPADWVDAYARTDGWHRLDQAQRRLEAWVTNLDEEPDERALGVVRRDYEDACHEMADGFTSALARAKWQVPGVLHQTLIFSEIVATRPRPVAYFFVDAMRFEMGAELADRLPRTAEVTVRPAIAALPSITPIGMAALLPGAAQSFTVVAEDGKLGARIDDTFLPDVGARKKMVAARIPKLVDLALDELLGLAPSKLRKRIADAQVVIVRSQEIDHAGEAGFAFQARPAMDNVIGNLARAVRKLAAAGIEQSVLSADHGHLFFGADRDESMRTDSPGGATVELHRRCWIGRGGTTPAGTLRVAAAQLGYASDLEFVFPTGGGIFKSGGDLGFHHGGPSLQELVVPVITVRSPSRAPAAAKATPIMVSGLPTAITNRIFSLTLTLGEGQLSLGADAVKARVVLVSGEEQVGAAAMAVDAEFDRATSTVKLPPGRPVTVALLLNNDQVASLRVVVQDPATDAELYRSPTDIPVRLGV